MRIVLEKKPRKPIVVEGFPGFGLIGTIATEFLIESLKAKIIGRFEYDELPATLAIHQGKIVHPMGIFYSKEHNLVILHTILNTMGFEWKTADSVMKMCKELNASEIISIEGVAGLMPTEMEPKTYYFSEDSKKASKLAQTGLEPLKESIIVGVTGALLLKSNIPISCLFAQTMSTLPDSKAAASIIEALDKYLGLTIDIEPLFKRAEEFEKKIRKIQEQSLMATKEQETKKPNYLG
ncbi:proteasome assembly chaperone family protein [Candidatus Woesearchaeota archaeon]|nr:proteasome assembly chaperone family protein [Candidatus Woesearchaeota archaeon]